MSAKSELQTRLEKLAYKRTIPFCYGCYVEAPSGRCAKCGSDDLMRILAGEGVDWGVSWVIPILLSEALTPANVEEAFEESIRECYPETTKIGWLEYDTVSALKELDPVSWRLAQSEWVNCEESDERLVSFDNGSTYYPVSDIEDLLDESETDGEAA